MLDNTLLELNICLSTKCVIHSCIGNKHKEMYREHTLCTVLCGCAELCNHHSGSYAYPYSFPLSCRGFLIFCLPVRHWDLVWKPPSEYVTLAYQCVLMCTSHLILEPSRGFWMSTVALLIWGQSFKKHIVIYVLEYV